MSLKVLLSQRYWHIKYIELLRKCNSDKLDLELDRERYYLVTRKWLNFAKPSDLNQKLIWLNWYWHNPLKTQCADKYLVREYVKDVGLDNILTPLIGVWSNAEDIDFESLPDQFVLKCNHGSAFNIICTNKDDLDVEATRKQLNEWLGIDYSRYYYENHYKGIPRRIVCERFIGDNNSAPTEYQFWCINGEPESILVCRKNLDHTYDAASYSLNWERLYDRKEEKDDVQFNKPECGISTLINYARQLTKPFPFVRADFYVVGSSVYLAELTFTPSTNILTNYKQSFLDRLGSKLTLPPKKRRKL